MSHPTATDPASMKSALSAFLASKAPFRILYSTSTSTPPRAPPHNQPPPPIAILDSSFNPPTRAHLSLATSVFTSAPTASSSSSSTPATAATATADAPRTHGAARFYAPPSRLVLLFAVHNADKAAAPAPFEARLALMARFAHDILDSLRPLTSPARTAAHDRDPASDAALAVDVAVTTHPFYSAKSASIDASGLYAGAPHVHLVGQDTFARILAPHYYAAQGFAPPLGALAPFFARHGLRVTLRDGALEEQLGLWRRLRDGEMEGDGGRREWAARCEVVEGEESGRGVSSTRVRRAMGKGEWAAVEELVTPRVFAFLRENAGLYNA